MQAFFAVAEENEIDGDDDATIPATRAAEALCIKAEVHKNDKDKCVQDKPTLLNVDDLDVVEHLVGNSTKSCIKSTTEIEKDKKGNLFYIAAITKSVFAI